MIQIKNFRHRYPSKTQGALVRFGVLIPLLAILSLAVGCASSLSAKSGRPIRVEPLDVMLQTDAASFGLASLGIFPFLAPQYAAGASKEVTDLYWAELLREGVFSRLIMIPRLVKSDGEALWWGRHEGCDLVMKPEITYFLDGSGALPTRMETSIQILDVRSGKLLWNLRQKVYSEPGADVDLFWHTIPGSPAQRYHLLARALAEQLSQYFRASSVGPAKVPHK